MSFTNRNKVLFILKAALSLLFLGCSTSLKIISEPQEVDIYIGEMGSEKRIHAGKTPLEISDADLEKKYKLSPSEMAFFQIYGQKKGYQSEKLLVPFGGWLQSSAAVRIFLKPGKEVGSDVERIVKTIFNAQKFVETRQLEKAQLELDKVINEYPHFARAMSMKAGIFYLQKQYDESKVWYEKALKEDPNTTDAIIMLDKIGKKLGL